MKKHLRIFSNARGALFLTHFVLFVALLGLGITVFTLPKSADSLLGIADGWDIFYKFLFSFIVDYAKEEYVNVGTYLTLFAFVHLVAALIAHGKFNRRFLVVNFFSCIPLVIFFPVGFILAAWSISLNYIYFVQLSRSSQDLES